MLEDIYNGSAATIVLHKDSSNIPIRKCVIEGDTFFTKFMKACLQEVFRTFDWEHLGLRFNREYFSNLRFTYDVALLNNSLEEFPSMLTALQGVEPWASK